MPSASNRGQRTSNYVFKFVGAASLLAIGTLVLVLFVLPERYVLSSGFREGDLNLPDPRTPFEPSPPLRIAAIPDIPRRVVLTPVPEEAEGPEVVPRGPAELFWERVLPLLEAERYEEAIRLFTDYLNEYPGDLGVRREYAITLAAAGYVDRAIPIFQGLLDYEDDDELHLHLARALRDVGSVEEASDHYRVVLARNPADEALILELARAWSWAEDFAAAEAVLLAGLETLPGSTELRAELARTYYLWNRLEDAQRILGTLTSEELEDQGLLELQADIVAWTTVPAASTPARTLLEQALMAREADAFERADSLFRAALEESPEAANAWRAYADFLQYERQDFDGALTALAEVERLSDDPDPTLQYRMAQLEAWTGRPDSARARLEALVGSPALTDVAGPVSPDSLPPGIESPTPPSRADALALLGDLERWNGEGPAAARHYEAALDEDPDNERARDGLAAVRAELDSFFVESERPGIDALASTFADSDDFRRYQAGGAWNGVQDHWAWATRTGLRRLEGVDPGAGLGARQGMFAELEGARWWRWGRVRTGIHLNVQNVRSDQADVGAGASLRLVASSGARTDLRYDHEPAFAATNTLQSVVANVRQDRLVVAHSRPLSDRWSGAVTAEAAALDHGEVADAPRNGRLQLAASVGRRLNPTFTAGIASRFLRFTDEAPTIGSATAPVRLYWDPAASVSVGPYVQMIHPMAGGWNVTGRAHPGLAYLRERGRSPEVVPDLSGRLGLLLESERFRASVEGFFGQGRFSAYRSYGLEVSFGARGILGAGSGS